MGKKSIQNSYSIDYVYPEDSKNSQPTEKKWLTTAILAIITIGLAASFFLPTDFSSIISKFTKPSSPSPTNEKLSEPETSTTPIDANITNTTENISTKKESIEATSNPETKIIETLEPANTPSIAPKLVTPSKPIEKVVEKTAEKLEPEKEQQDTSAQLAISLKQLAINEELTRNIEKLSQQLLAEQKKNEVLNSQLKVRKNRNNALSSLLENALEKANDTDKRYVAALNGQIQKSKKTNRIRINAMRARNDVAKRITLDTKRVDYNNSISISDTVQIDAILAAMQASSTPKLAPEPLESSNNEGSTIVQIPNQLKTVISAPDNQLYASLQNQINLLINDDSPKSTVKVSPTNNTAEETLEEDYRKALNAESAVRLNEMRTITIIKGDTLWAIAKRAYGNGSQYKKIINANPNIVNKGKVLLLVGQVIRVPN